MAEVTGIRTSKRIFPQCGETDCGVSLILAGKNLARWQLLDRGQDSCCVEFPVHVSALR
jgi:hypothetical protein